MVAVLAAVGCPVAARVAAKRWAAVPAAAVLSAAARAAAADLAASHSAGPAPRIGADVIAAVKAAVARA
jgi:hypothetical protein